MPLGWQETVFIFVLALLIFGPKKLPELGKTVGKAMTEFRRASSELRATWDREMASMERETESLKAETRKIEGEIQSSINDGTDYYNTYYDSGYEYGGNTEASSPTVGETEVLAAEQTTPGTVTEPAAAAEQTVAAALPAEAAASGISEPAAGSAAAPPQSGAAAAVPTPAAGQDVRA